MYENATHIKLLDLHPQKRSRELHFPLYIDKCRSVASRLALAIKLDPRREVLTRALPSEMK